MELKVLDVSRPDEPVMDEIVNTNQIIKFHAPKPGDYLVEAYIAGRLAARRRLRILSWDLLDSSQPEQPFDVKVGTFSLRGAIIKVNEAGENKEA